MRWEWWHEVDLAFVDARHDCCYDSSMPVTFKKSKGKTDEAIIADATDRLLLATKKKMLKDEGRVDYEKLARDGFSAEMIERLKTL